MRQYRKRAGLTQVELALLADTHQSRISQMEAGLLVPKGDELRRIAEALGIEPDEVIEGRS